MTTVIAEVGVNHNGEEELALQLVDAAHAAGADMVKFQTFRASEVATSSANQAAYQLRNTVKREPQLAMLKRLELDHQCHRRIIAYCAELGIEFLSTAFDSASLSFLVDELGLKTLKISSGDLNNLPFLLDHARTGCNLILSTGMASLGDVEEALSVIAFGLTTHKHSAPSMEGFLRAYRSAEGQLALKKKVTILHCTSEYPAPATEINLLAIKTLANAFHLPVGYSDHSEGIAVPVAAAALGCAIIEKHFTLDREMPGPDHRASLEPRELTAMIDSIRVVEVAMGNGLKIPQHSEVENMLVARKSLVASRDLSIGEIITEDSIEIKRPGNGMAPRDYWKILGRKYSRNYKEGEMLDE